MSEGENRVTLTPGQVWAYRTRRGEEKSTLVICRIDPHDKLGVIVHLTIKGLQVKNPEHPAGFSSTIIHAPVTTAVLRDSLTHLVATDAPPEDYRDAYDSWQAAFAKGETGVWTQPVAEIVGLLEDAINQSG